MRRFASLATLLFLALGLVPALAAAQATPVGGSGRDPGLGTAVPYLSAEGTTLGRLTVLGVVDPFTAYDPSSSPERGNRFVLLDLAVQNTGAQPWSFDPHDVILQDDAGFVYASTSIERSEAATPVAAPDLSAGDLAPGSQARGAIAYTVPTAAHIVRVFYRPDTDRLVLLAHLP
jgi:hypothetical protein